MPIYGFKCPICEEEIESLQKVGDPPPICDLCEVVMKKTLTAASFDLKGPGFYREGFQ